MTITPLVPGAAKDVPIVQCPDKVADDKSGCSCRTVRAGAAAPGRWELWSSLMGLIVLLARRTRLKPRRR